MHLLPGIGEFSARLIVLRGAGLPDAPIGREPRFLQIVSQLYGFDREPTDAEIATITERWIPYRVSCAVLLRAGEDE